MTPMMSIVIPALNEEALIGETLRSVRASIALLPPEIATEIIVVDNGSKDGTRDAVRLTQIPVRIVDCPMLGAARARNLGASHSVGEVLVFLDADTTIPLHALQQIANAWHEGKSAGITGLAARKPGFRAQTWWLFWNAVRHLPWPYAKAMPACMFCTRAIFDEFGPFNEDVAIGEEWPILARAYRYRPREFVYMHRLVARTSGRRMELTRFGYTRLFCKYLWAIVDRRGRIHYAHTIRQARAAVDELT